MASDARGLRLLRPREVAAVTGLERWRVYALIREGRLPVIRVGSTYRVSEAALAIWIEREQGQPERTENDECPDGSDSPTPRRDER